MVETELPRLEASRGDDLRSTGAGESFFASWSQGNSERLLIERAPGDTAAAYTQKRYLLHGNQRTLIREQKFAVREDGAVVLVEEINHTEKVEVVFTPPLVVIPAEIGSNAPLVAEGRMTVHPLGDRSKVRAKGTLKDSITCVGAARITTPAGTFDTWKLHSVFEAQLGPSRVHNETDLWLVPGTGIVAERRQEKTTVMGVAVRNNAEGWVLASPAASRPRP